MGNNELFTLLESEQQLRNTISEALRMFGGTEPTLADRCLGEQGADGTGFSHGSAAGGCTATLTGGPDG
eukprot:2821874-Lingulodinium_polyedra.AAC.1